MASRGNAEVSLALAGRDATLGGHNVCKRVRRAHFRQALPTWTLLTVWSVPLVIASQYGSANMSK
jgi:hypothetical protein